MIFSYYRKGKKMIQKCNWRPDWGGSQIGAEARLVQRPDWRRGQIGWEARLAGKPDWLGSQIGWEARLAERSENIFNDQT